MKYTDFNLPWHKIQSVFLDMDGTLLDLNFDNHFWQVFVPIKYAEKHQLDLRQAQSILAEKYKSVEGTIDWYCIDYWSEQLDLDIEMLKHEVAHLIAIHPHVVPFLKKIKKSDKRLVLVTNAHGKSLSLKMKKTSIGAYFDNIICAHDIGVVKEAPEFWDRLQKKEAFNPESTLLVDDSLSVLKSAQQYGIAYLISMTKPDTQAPVREINEFSAIHHFDEIMP